MVQVSPDPPQCTGVKILFVFSMTPETVVLAGTWSPVSAVSFYATIQPLYGLLFWAATVCWFSRQSSLSSRCLSKVLFVRPSSISRSFLVEAIMAKPFLSGDLFFRSHEVLNPSLFRFQANRLGPVVLG